MSSDVQWDRTGPSRTRLGDDRQERRPKKSSAKTKETPPRATDAKADGKAALAFERGQARRQSERKEEAAKEKERARRQHAVDKAQQALSKAKPAHEERAAAAIEVERDALDERSGVEDARWERERARLEKNLRRARDM